MDGGRAGGRTDGQADGDGRVDDWLMDDGRED